MSLENASSWECRVSVHCERVKEEPELEPEASAASGERQERGRRPVKQEPGEAGLYANHEVKGELVLGPTVLQPPDAAFAPSAALKRTEHTAEPAGGPRFRASRGDQVRCRACSVRLERLGDRLDVSPPCAERPAGGRGPGASCGEHLQRGQRDPQKKPHTCEICLNQFPSTIHLRNHKRVHVGEKPYKCEFCKKCFSVRSTLLAHERMHTGERPYKCKFCLKCFSQLSSLLTHKRIHTGEKAYKCEICYKNFVQVSSLVRHVRRHAGPCAACPPSALRGARRGRGALLRRARGRGGPPGRAGGSRDVSPPAVERPGPRPGASRGAQPRLRACSVRLERLPPHEEKHANSTILRTSVERQTNQAIKPKPELYSCDACGEQFARKRTLIRHIQLHSSGLHAQAPTSSDPNIVHSERCSGPMRRKPSSGSLQKSNGHTSAILIPSHKTNLIHHKPIHTDKKPYKCELCMKCFTHKYSLLIHNRIHTGKKPYKCELCMKGFSQKWDLMNHKRIHTGEKPYKCKLCMKRFSQKSNLFRHERIHSGEKPYKCELCMKSFSQKSNLIQHDRIHTGEKPYKCELCTKYFSHRNSLLLHNRIHTGEKH